MYRPDSQFQESLLHEMWQDLKFAVDWRAGDTKPIKPGSSASRIGRGDLGDCFKISFIGHYSAVLKGCRSWIFKNG